MREKQEATMKNAAGIFFPRPVIYIMSRLPGIGLAVGNYRTVIIDIRSRPCPAHFRLGA